MFSSHRWTKERVKWETERVIWSLGLKTVRVGSQNFLFGSTFYVGCNGASTKLKFNHFSSGAWKLNNDLQYVSQYKYRVFNQLFSSHNCLFPTIDLCNIIFFVADDIFQLCWWPDDPPLIQQEHWRDGQSFHNHHWAHMASIIPSSAKGTHLFPIKSCKSIIKHHQGTNTLPC